MTTAPDFAHYENIAQHPATKYFRFGAPGTPHIWCEGCGIGQIFYYTCIAIEELGLDPNQIVGWQSLQATKACLPVKG